VRRDLSVRVDAAARKYLDHLCTQFGFGGGREAGEAELLRVLIVSSCLTGNPPRDRAAAALYVNTGKKFAEKSARLAGELQNDFSRYAAELADSKARVRITHAERPPAAGVDRAKIRVKIDSLLAGRLTRLVTLLEQLRAGQAAVVSLQVERALAAYVRKHPAILQERSLEAAVVRWAVLIQPVQEAEITEQVVRLYIRLWDRMFEVIDRSFEAAREAARAALREGEEHVRQGP